MSQLTARRHHYVPQFYLKGFVENRNQPKLFAVDTKKKRSFWTPPANVAVEHDFHTIEAPGQPPDIVESKLAELESEISTSLERIIRNRSLSNQDDRALLFSFMALLLIKNPGMRERIGTFIGTVAMARFKVLASDEGAWAKDMERAKEEGSIPRDSDTDELRALALADAFNISVSTPGHLQLEFNLVDKLVLLIASRRWMLYRTPRDATGFVTSDNPVSLAWANQRRPDRPGWAPRHAAYFSDLERLGSDRSLRNRGRGR